MFVVDDAPNNPVLGLGCVLPNKLPADAIPPVFEVVGLADVLPEPNSPAEAGGCAVDKESGYSFF